MTRTSKIKSGVRFEQELVRSALKQGIHVHKIPTAKQAHFGRDSIYDIMMLYNGQYAGIECKVVHDTEAFPFSRVSEHQIKALENVHLNGGRGLVIINIRIPRQQEIKVVPITAYINMQTTSSRKSMDTTTLLNLPGIKKTGADWDVQKIFGLQYP